MNSAASLHAAIHEEVALQAYDASWPSRFAAERERRLDQRLRFRDALRASPELAARYAALKIELATKHPTDREAYTDAKAAFVISASGS